MSYTYIAACIETDKDLGNLCLNYNGTYYHISALYTFMKSDIELIKKTDLISKGFKVAEVMYSSHDRG